MVIIPNWQESDQLVNYKQTSSLVTVRVDLNLRPPVHTATLIEKIRRWSDGRAKVS